MCHLINVSMNEVSDHSHNLLLKTEQTIKNTSSFWSGFYFLGETADTDQSLCFSRIKRTINILQRIMSTAFLTILNGETENVSRDFKVFKKAFCKAYF